MSAATTRFGGPFTGPRQPGCVVINYHRVGIASDPFPNLDVANFGAQMAWLARNCNVIAPEDFRERAESGVATSKPNVMVTFDDGYRDYFDHAYPVLQRHRIRAMNFLCTRFVDEPGLIGWWDRLYLAVRATRKPSVTSPWDVTKTYELNPAGRAAFLAAAKD